MRFGREGNLTSFHKANAIPDNNNNNHHIILDSMSGPMRTPRRIAATSPLASRQGRPSVSPTPNPRRALFSSPNSLFDYSQQTLGRSQAGSQQQQSSQQQQQQSSQQQHTRSQRPPHSYQNDQPDEWDQELREEEDDDFTNECEYIIKVLTQNHTSF